MFSPPHFPDYFALLFYYRILLRIRVCILYLYLLQFFAVIFRCLYRVGQKSDTARALHYTVREVSLFWPTLYIQLNTFVTARL